MEPVIHNKPRTSRAWTSAIAAFLALTMGATASANFTCEGKIAYLGLGPDGTVTVDIGFGAWYICNLTSSFPGNGGINFSPEGCRGWYASILANQKTDAAIVFFFQSSAATGNGPECSLGSWVTPNPSPYHMTVRK